MVSFWPWGKEDSSPASFERTLSALTTKITTTQAQLDKVRSSSRRVKVLCTLYLGFAYLVYAIVLMLVVGWRYMGPLEWTGMAGGPVLIYLVRTATTAIFDYRINTLSARLKVLQFERNKTIQKLKDATKYDSTLELLEKYGGAENKPKKSKKKADDDDGSEGEKKRRPQGKTGGAPTRTNLPPPPTANIQRPVSFGPGTPAPKPQGPFGTLSPQLPRLDMSTSAEFAPNAFDGKAPEIIQYAPPTVTMSTETHWYDRILDTLLGEDETAAKNRIVLICSRCRLVNGQAPPGTKSLTELGMWKCMSCGATNGEMDEGKRIVQEVLGEQGVTTDENTEDDGLDEKLAETGKGALGKTEDAEQNKDGTKGKEKGKKEN